MRKIGGGTKFDQRLFEQFHSGQIRADGSIPADDILVVFCE